MFLNAIVYCLPVYGFLKTIAQVSTITFEEEKDKSESHLTERTNNIIKNILMTEYNSDGEYKGRIQDMLEDLDELECKDKPPKTIDSLITHRFKIVDTSEKSGYIGYTTGNDIGENKYYIALHPEIDKILPFIASHELGHALNEDAFKVSGIETAASFGAAVLTSFCGLDLSLPTSAATVLATWVIAHIATSHQAESRADDLAVKYCSKEELESGKIFLERYQAVIEELPIWERFKVKISQFYDYPSLESRMIKLQKAINEKSQMILSCQRT